MEDESTERLREWLIGKGGKVHESITCARLPSAAHRGIVAINEIQSNDILVSVPSSILIGKESALRDAEVVAAVAPHAACVTDAQLVAIHLLRECSKGSASFWYPYLRTLPRSYTTACSLTDDEIEQLQLNFAQRAIFRSKEEAVSSFDMGFKILSSIKSVQKRFKSLKAWVWALSTLSSRTMYIPGDTIGALTPYGDLHNYGCPPPPFTLNINASNIEEPVSEQVIHGDGSLDTINHVYNLYARRAHAKGEEVLLCYGRHTNLHLLEYYGFCLEDNPHDTAPLPLEYFDDTVQQQLNSLGVSDTDVYIAYNGTPSFELMRALRLASLSSSERKKYTFKVLNDEAVGQASERKAYQFLAKAIHIVLGQTTLTSMEYDTKLLENTNQSLTDGQRVVIQYRLGYKRMLWKCLDLLHALQIENHNPQIDE